MYDAIIAEHLKPLQPEPTGRTPRVERLPNIRAVLFDIYGTLLISGSGDVGTAAAVNKGDALDDALAAVGLAYRGDSLGGLSDFTDTIKAHHAKLHDAGIEYPEVRIGEVWDDVLEIWRERGTLEGDADEASTSKLAIEYEMRVNPVWPMPGVAETLRALTQKGKVLGVVSNAQSFTPRLFAAAGRLIDELGPLESLGVNHELQFFSFESRRAKPGTSLYEEAVAGLAERGLEPSQTLYVGNDLLNDVMPAAKVGFRTALFSGDARSLRLRESDERVEGVQPDVEVTQLPQLLDCV